MILSVNHAPVVDATFVCPIPMSLSALRSIQLQSSLIMDWHSVILIGGLRRLQHCMAVGANWPKVMNAVHASLASESLIGLRWCTWYVPLPDVTVAVSKAHIAHYASAPPVVKALLACMAVAFISRSPHASECDLPCEALNFAGICPRSFIEKAPSVSIESRKRNTLRMLSCLSGGIFDGRHFNTAC